MPSLWSQIENLKKTLTHTNQNHQTWKTKVIIKACRSSIDNWKTLSRFIIFSLIKRDWITSCLNFFFFFFLDGPIRSPISLIWKSKKLVHWKKFGPMQWKNSISSGMVCRSCQITNCVSFEFQTHTPSYKKYLFHLHFF